MRIALDLEGVLADSNAIFPKVLAERIGRPVPQSFQYQWNLREAAKHALGVGIDEEMHADLWLGTWQRWKEIPLVGVGAIVFFDRMEDMGHKVEILTHSFSPAIENYKWEWILSNLGLRPTVWVNGDKRKEDYDYDIFIDDGPHNLVALKRVGKRAICFTQPWNLGVGPEWYWIRVSQLGFAASAIWEIR